MFELLNKYNRYTGKYKLQNFQKKNFKFQFWHHMEKMEYLHVFIVTHDFSPKNC